MVTSARGYQRSWTWARMRRSYRSAIAASSASLNGGSAAAAAFCSACAALRAPGITVETPGCWITQRRAAWAGVAPAGARAANSRAASTPVSKSTPENVSPTSKASPCRL